MEKRDNLRFYLHSESTASRSPPSCPSTGGQCGNFATGFLPDGGVFGVTRTTVAWRAQIQVSTEDGFSSFVSVIKELGDVEALLQEVGPWNFLFGKLDFLRLLYTS